MINLFYKNSSQVFVNKSIIDKKKKNIYLTKKYEENFILFLEKKTYDKDLFIQGINEYTLYIESYLFSIISGVAVQNPLEKKLLTLFAKVSFFQDLSIEIKEIASDSVYIALGVIDKKKKFLKKSNNSYLLKYIQSIAFYKTLSFLETTHSNLNREIENFSDNFEIDNSDIEHICSTTRLKNIMSSDLFSELCEALHKGTSLDKSFDPYIKILKEEFSISLTS